MHPKYVYLFSFIIQSIGRAYIFSGTNGALIKTLDSPTQQVSGYFGNSVSGVPDVDGDDRDDVVVGAYRVSPGSNPQGAGRAYIFSSASGNLLQTLASLNETTDGEFGTSVAGVSDIDGDGRGDVIVGAPHESPNDMSFAGRVYLFSGATGSPLNTFTSPNRMPHGRFGASVCGIADVSGDGRGDIIIGAPGDDPDGSPARPGRAYIFNGTTGLLVPVELSKFIIE